MAELAVQGVSVHFGGVQALDGVDLEVSPGRVTGLIGPNGAGKTTLFNVITGLQTPNSGRVVVGGRDVTALAPHHRARLGLARTFQRLELFGTLSARENVQMALETRRHGATNGAHGVGGGRDTGAVRRAFGRREPRGTAERAEALLSQVGARHVADEPADLLPTGLARLVELARALATSPSVLLLDEPSGGLDDRETSALGAVLEELASHGMSVLLVEHDIGLVMSVCRHVAVMDFGAIVSEGDPAGIQRDPVVQAAYLGPPDRPERSRPRGEGAGDAVEEPVGAGPPAVGATSSTASGEVPGVTGGAPAGSREEPVPPALELSDIRAGYGRIEIVHGVSLSLARGSVLALLGPNGAGKSTLLKAASGQLGPTSGRVLLEGEDVAGEAGERLVRRGLCAVPEGRPVFPNLTVVENLLMYSYARKGLDPQELEEQSYERFPVLRDRRRQLAGRLSGGEQQALALARALCSGARVLLVDELSMGLAPLVVADLYDRLARLVSEESVSVLLVEQFAKTALALAAEAAIMVNGRIVRRGPPAELEPELLSSYMGATG